MANLEILLAGSPLRKDKKTILEYTIAFESGYWTNIRTASAYNEALNLVTGVSRLFAWHLLDEDWNFSKPSDFGTWGIALVVMANRQKTIKPGNIMVGFEVQFDQAEKFVPLFSEFGILFVDLSTDSGEERQKRFLKGEKVW